MTRLRLSDKPVQCRHCIYKFCGKTGNDAEYCLIRFLIWEVESK